MQTPTIKIAITDDHALFRSGVASLISEFTDIEVVFEAGNGQQMQQCLQQHPLPEVMLMDINMPVMDGYKATAWLRANHPGIKVLALSMYEDDKAVMQMIRQGACGYVLKESSPFVLLEAIRTANQKGIYINELVTGKMMRTLRSHDDEVVLTEKEMAFLKLCCSELTYKEMADRLFVSPRTVDNYRESLFQKLDLKSRSGLILYAIENGIFKLPQSL